MMETKEKVDVLAVIDESIRMQERYMPTPLGGTNEHPVRFMERMHDLKLARAAVAELIEAGRMRKHFVEFFSPGTFFPESSVREIRRRDVDEAVKMARSIVERYGAKPYGFRFFDRVRTNSELDSRIVDRSGMYYLGGKIETLAEVEARNDPKEEILRSNMRSNGIAEVIVNDNSWRFTGEFNDGDTLLDVTL